MLASHLVYGMMRDMKDKKKKVLITVNGQAKILWAKPDQDGKYRINLDQLENEFGIRRGSCISFR